MSDPPAAHGDRGPGDRGPGAPHAARRAPATPDPAARQVSGLDPEGRFVLSVLVKRTYRFDASGRCERADEDLPLVVDPVFDPDRPGLLRRDSDLYPYKPRADVIVQGRAYAPRAAASFEATITIGSAVKRIAVFGERRASMRPDGRITFSAPAPVDEVPLVFERAYGGADAVACARHGNPVLGLAQHLPELPSLAQINPYAYPRNPNGVGFLLEATPGAVEALALPCLEDPDDLLTPERLAVERLDRWPAQPLPAAPGWVSHAWFPRAAYLGFLPADRDVSLREVALGALPRSLLEAPPGPPAADLGFANGAPAGLQLPSLRGDEAITLVNLCPGAPRVTIHLPGERPRLWTDGRKGKRGETEPVVHTLLIEPDEGRLSLVWRGACRALRPYTEEELAAMPFWVEG